MKTIGLHTKVLSKNIGGNTFKVINLIGLVAACCFAFGVHFIPDFNLSYSYAITFVVIITLGLIHGSLDYDVDAGSKPSPNLLLFLVKYTFQMVIIAAIWMVAPALALSLFLLFTAWHFGETDFSLFKLNFEPVTVMLYGVGITGWLLGSHYTPERKEFTDALSFFIEANTSTNYTFEQLTKLLSLVSFGLIVVAAVWSKLYRNPTALLILATLLLITWFLPLLLSFTFYFGFWHSMHTINLIKNDIKVNNKVLFIKAVPYLGTSIVMGIASIFVLEAFNQNTELALFVFISSLTLPHATVMHQMLKRFRSGEKMDLNIEDRI
jgi:Brp/Blh family beta-carotene 15,15'-monooxygenase